MGLCLFREEHHDQRILKLAELKKKFHSVISKEENLQNETEFLWAQCFSDTPSPQDIDVTATIGKLQILGITQKFIDQIDGGDEESLSSIDQIINVLPVRTTFTVFKAYVADIIVVLDDELTRRYLHALSARDALCTGPYDDNIKQEKPHFCYTARNKNRTPFRLNENGDVVQNGPNFMQNINSESTDVFISGKYQNQMNFNNGANQFNQQSILLNEQLQQQNQIQNKLNQNPGPVSQPIYASTGGSFQPLSQSYNSVNGYSANLNNSLNNTNSNYLTNLNSTNLSGPGPNSGQIQNQEVPFGGPVLNGNLAAPGGPIQQQQPVQQYPGPANPIPINSSSQLRILPPPQTNSTNWTPVPSTQQIAVMNNNYRGFSGPGINAVIDQNSGPMQLPGLKSVEMVRDALLSNGLQMQVFNSSYELEWKIIRLIVGEGSTGPNQIQMVNPDTKSSMQFLLSELDEIARGQRCLELSEDIAEAAYAQLSDPAERLAAFVFGTDGFLILVMPDKDVGELCFKAFKTFGMQVN